MDARVEGVVGALEGVDRQRARNHSGREDPFAGEQGVESDGGRHLGAVDQRQALLRSEHQRLQAEPRQGVCRRDRLAGQDNPALPDQRRAEMGQRREVPGCADRALRRDQRQGIGLEQHQQPLDHLPPDPRMAAAEPDRLQGDDQAHDPGVERLAEAAAVRQDEVALQLLEPIGRDPRLGEQAEAGIDAVDGTAAGDDPPDGGGRRRDRLPAAIAEPHRRPFPDRAQLRQRRRAGIEDQRIGHRPRP